MANTDRSITDNVPSPAPGPALNPELDMAALIANATPRTPRTVEEINTGNVAIFNGESGLWWA